MINFKKLTFSINLIIIIQLLSSITLADIEEDIFTLTNISPGLYALQLSIGYPMHNFLLLVDISSKYTWLRGTNCTFCAYTDNIYDEEASISVIHQEEIPYTTITDIKGSVSGNILYDDVKIGDYYATKVELLIASEDEYLESADGVLSLKYPKEPNDSRNIINKLFISGYIRQKILYFNFKDEMTGTLMIGKIPKTILNDKKNYSTCHIQELYNNNWNCLVTHILFDDNYNFYQATVVDSIVIFSTGIEKIYAPKNTIELFINNYFKNLPEYDDKKCIIKIISGIHQIYCLKSFLNIEGPSIHFIFNGYAYRIPFEDLFDDVYTDSYNRYKLFKIEFYETEKKEWYFGTVFLKQYETVFDAENKVVGFYGNNKFDFTKYTNEEYEVNCWYNSISVFLLFSVVIIPMIYNVSHKLK
jgi:hypothetical protein